MAVNISFRFCWLLLLLRKILQKTKTLKLYHDTNSKLKEFNINNIL